MSFARITHNKFLLLALTALVAAAVVGTTVGYAALSKQVTLSLDGETQQVSTTGGNVGDVLADEGVEVSDEDIVVPSADAPVEEDTRISVRFARPLELTVNGRSKTFTVHSAQVSGALAELGRRFNGADMSVSRSAEISRAGMALDVVTAKNLTIRIGDRKPVTQEVTATTVRDVVKELNMPVDRNDQFAPGLDARVKDGTTLRVHTIGYGNVTDRGQVIDHDTVEKTDAGMFENESEVRQEGRDGRATVQYRAKYRDGEIVKRKVTDRNVTRQPVDEVVAVGTKERPEPEPEPKAEPEPEPEPTPASGGANFASGNTVWDRLAQCESGGNWAINTGNGYYGGLQFNLSTWHSYGGTGRPDQNSRAEQIRIAEKVRAARGGYGAWPACSQELGLPQ